jgi:hypothetical protein
VGWLMAGCSGCCTTYFFSFFRFSLLRVDFVIFFSSSPFHRHKSTGDIHFVLCFPPSLFLNSSLYLLLDDLNVKSEGKKNKIKTKYEKGKGKGKKMNELRKRCEEVGAAHLQPRQQPHHTNPKNT